MFGLVCCCCPAGEPTIGNTAAIHSSANSSTYNSSGKQTTARSRPQHGSSTAEQLLADYYAGKLRPALPAAAGAVVREASAQQYPWAKPEWGRYRQRAVVAADPAGRGLLAIWAWDIVPEVGPLL
jgi:hypothetical protein